MVTASRKNQELAPLLERFRGIRTLCTGIMGYLAMLHEGDFKGGERQIVEDLRKATVSVATKLDALRDEAVRVTRGRSSEVDDAAAVIVASEPRIRLPLQALAKRLASFIPGLPSSHWADDLRMAQAIVREVATMNDALKAAHAAGDRESTVSD